MARTIRKEAIRKYECAIRELGHCDGYLQEIDSLVGERNAPAKEIMPAIIQSTEICRQLWRELRSRL